MERIKIILICKYFFIWKTQESWMKLVLLRESSTMGEKKNTRISYTKYNLQKRERGTLMGHRGISKRHGADGTWLTEKYQRALIQPGEGKHTTLN